MDIFTQRLHAVARDGAKLHISSSVSIWVLTSVGVRRAKYDLYDCGEFRINMTTFGNRYREVTREYPADPSRSWMSYGGYGGFRFLRGVGGGPERPAEGAAHQHTWADFWVWSL